MVNMHDQMNIARFKKMGYQEIFGIEGTAGHAALQDFANYCRVFDVAIHDHDAALVAVGLRRAFFHIWQYLKLEPDELAVLYRDHVLKQDGE